MTQDSEPESVMTQDRHDCGGIIYRVSDDRRRFCPQCGAIPDECRICNGSGERTAVINGEEREIVCGTCGGDGVAK